LTTEKKKKKKKGLPLQNKASGIFKTLLAMDLKITNLGLNQMFMEQRIAKSQGPYNSQHSLKCKSIQSQREFLNNFLQIHHESMFILITQIESRWISIKS
jgi:hypothetical protein